MQTFAERFGAAKDAPIHYNGRDLHRQFVLPVKKGDSIGLRFLRATDRPVQGVGVKCEKCEISIADTRARSFGLWTDTAPSEVILNVVKAQADARVVFFNQWRDEKYGSTMYHLNNAAMEIVPQPDGSVLLRCSDGWGEPDFNDLVLQVKPGT